MKCEALETDGVRRVRDAFRGANAWRNRALFLTQCYTGFRAQEILSLARGDVVNAWGRLEDKLMVKATNMKGKAKSRTVKLNESAQRVLLEWVNELEYQGFVSAGSPLWPRRDGQPLTYDGMVFVYKTAFRLAGFDLRGYATHTPRKTFALHNHRHLMEKLKAGTLTDDPIMVLRDLLGHADIRATVHYLPRPTSGDDALACLGNDW